MSEKRFNEVVAYSVDPYNKGGRGYKYHITTYSSIRPMGIWHKGMHAMISMMPISTLHRCAVSFARHSWWYSSKANLVGARRTKRSVPMLEWMHSRFRRSSFVNSHPSWRWLGLRVSLVTEGYLPTCTLQLLLNRCEFPTLHIDPKRRYSVGEGEKPNPTWTRSWEEAKGPKGTGPKEGQIEARVLLL